MNGGQDSAALATNVGSKGSVEELEVIKRTELKIPEDLVAGVRNTASAYKVSMSTAGDESTGVSFFFSASSFKYSTLMR